jgi:transcriptional regulator with XRE-family HTH domain
MEERPTLRDARIAKRLQVQELAALAGVSRDTIRRAERGIPISELSQERIARALGYGHRRELFVVKDVA